jgi:hypothetical protein
MNTGTKYLFDNVYQRLANGEDVHLSELDFDCFVLEDVSTLQNIYNDEIERPSAQTQRVIQSLQNMEPICVAVSFA